MFSKPPEVGVVPVDGVVPVVGVVAGVVPVVVPVVRGIVELLPLTYGVDTVFAMLNNCGAMLLRKLSRSLNLF